jgi:hypothetical protein
VRGKKIHKNCGGTCSFIRWEDMKALVGCERCGKQFTVPARHFSPSVRKLQRWVEDGVARALDGCDVEPDGTCLHGHPSWLLVLGYV